MRNREPAADKSLIASNLYRDTRPTIEKDTYILTVSRNEMSKDTLYGYAAKGGAGMNTWDEYRVKAAELSARAACETDAQIQAQLESLAQSYMRLALQAEQNSRLDLTYETPLPKGDNPAAKR